MTPPHPVGPAPDRLPDAAIFPETDYRHRLQLVRGSFPGFFGAWNQPVDLLTQRRRWLAETPHCTLLLRPEAAAGIEESFALASAHGLLPPPAGTAPPPPPPCPRPGTLPDPSSTGAETAPHRWRQLASLLEPDLVLLQPTPHGLVMVAGAVCFPSSWAPEEKLGRTLRQIHDAVPGLNAGLGQALDGALERLRPDAAWLRANWGFSASPEPNQHPARGLPRLQPPLDPAATWLRIEHQALVALPASRALLFGIRVEQRPLSEVLSRPETARALARALRTMPDDMARYKGLAAARDTLAETLGRV